MFNFVSVIILVFHLCRLLSTWIKANMDFTLCLMDTFLSYWVLFNKEADRTLSLYRIHTSKNEKRCPLLSQLEHAIWFDCDVGIYILPQSFWFQLVCRVRSIVKAASQPKVYCFCLICLCKMDLLMWKMILNISLLGTLLTVT